ncbi:DUF7144 family membrane protein [Agromyces italicus]|uniref:DUF7144 family membrane protein n=1 Tax=Agromyces italicus TaxID=279572 RepID=UPI0003B472A5|nr:hypothetical protein [Agromyces italicus]
MTEMQTGQARPTGWVGWGAFAAIMLVVSGGFDLLYGFIALFMADSAYFVRTEGGLFIFDVQGWGWWHVISGALLIVIGAVLFTGATWARVVAVLLVIVNAIGQLALLPVQPWWSLIVLTLDIVVIYALTVHGKELAVRR